MRLSDVSHGSRKLYAKIMCCEGKRFVLAGETVTPLWQSLTVMSIVDNQTSHDA